MADVQLSTRSASVKTAYEANADTNPFTDLEQAKLARQVLSATALQTSADSPITAASGELVRIETDAEITVNAPAPADLAEGEVFGVQIVTGDALAFPVTIERNGHGTIEGLATFHPLDSIGTYMFRRQGTNLTVTSGDVTVRDRASHIAMVPPAGVAALNLQDYVDEVEARGSGFPSSVVTGAASPVGAGQDGQNVVLTHTAGAILVTMQNDVAVGQGGMVTKQTTQAVTVSMETSAAYLLSDGATTASTNFTMHGAMTWQCIAKAGADDPIYLIKGETTIPSVQRGQITVDNVLITVTTVTGARTITTADSGKTLRYTGSGHTFTFPGAGVTAGCHGVIRNNGTGVITISTTLIEKFTGTEPIPINASATWESDGSNLWLDVNA